ncbi:hypothetical protein JTB14_017526 [Gonioctena quinquepunctata]|nr:hypothetical protein JTB14_017525 [Gonioctena quinquepunctata]KAG5872845.1 hypothetical protein JTB14_017526 [Gonioctena quinquepunctata]
MTNCLKKGKRVEHTPDFLNVFNLCENLLANLKDPASKLHGWKVLISEYNFEIEHIKGKENIVPDALTRNPPNHDNISIIGEAGDNNETIDEFIENSENYQLECHTTTINSAQEASLLTFPYSNKPLNYHKK